MNSDEIIASLRDYGTLVAFQSERDKTWRVKAILFMHGCRTEVSSDFGHPTMNSALVELQTRVYRLVERNARAQCLDGDIEK